MVFSLSCFYSSILLGKFQFCYSFRAGIWVLGMCVKLSERVSTCQTLCLPTCLHRFNCLLIVTTCWCFGSEIYFSPLCMKCPFNVMNAQEAWRSCSTLSSNSLLRLSSSLFLFLFYSNHKFYLSPHTQLTHAWSSLSFPIPQMVLSEASGELP